MWNNLLVFSGICLFSLNILSLSKSMEFPSSKFNGAQQTWKNQRNSRVDTSVSRKLTRRNAYNVATSKPYHDEQIKNKDHLTRLSKDDDTKREHFFIRRRADKKENYFGRRPDERKNLRSCLTNYSSDVTPDESVTKTIFKTFNPRIDATNAYKLRRTSLTDRTNVNNPSTLPTSNARHFVAGREHGEIFKSQLSLNGCDNKTCEINVRKNSITGPDRTRVPRTSETKNATGNDNPINEELMRTKRTVLKAHHRFGIVKKIRSGRLNVSPTDYPINVNFHPAIEPFNETNEFRANHSLTHACVPSLTDRSNNYMSQRIRAASLVENTNRRKPGNETSSAKEPIKKNQARRSNFMQAKGYDNDTDMKNDTGERLIENQYPTNIMKLKYTTYDHRYARIITNNKYSRIKRQSRYENVLSNRITVTALSAYSTETSTQQMEIDENKVTSTQYYDTTTRKSNQFDAQLNITYDNSNNKTAAIIGDDHKSVIRLKNEATIEPSALQAENLILLNHTEIETNNRSESEKLRRLTSSCEMSSSNTTKKTIFILGLFALTKGSSKRVAGESETAAAFLAIKHINQMQILGCEYELQMLVNNTQEDPGVALNNFFYAMYKDQQKKIKALLGSSNAEVTHALAKITLAWDIPTISFGFSSPQLSDNKKYPMFFRTVAPDSSHNQARIAFLHFFKWNAITTICQQEDLYSWGINDLSTKLEESNITQGKTISFSEQDFEAHLKLMPEEGSKIIVGSFSNKVAPKIFCTVYDMGLYGGDYVWILPGTLENRWWNTNKYCAKQKLIKAVNGLILISSKKQLDEDEYAVSFVNEKEFQNLLPKLKSEFVREAYDAVWAAALSLNRTLSWCKNGNNSCMNKSFHKSFQKQFVNNFQHIQFKGTSGPILFHGADRICITNFYQIQDGEIFPIAQYDPLTLKLNFNCSSCKEIIWPSGYIPVSKRTYELHIMNITPVAFYVINSFAVLGILVSLCFLVFNIYYREQKYIKLSSPYLNATTIVGCVLVYLAVIFLGIDNSTMPPAFTFQTVCTARVALLSTGCSLAFGSIFAKTYRVHQIFIKSNHGILKSKVLQDSRLVPIIGVFVLIDGVIIVIWTAIDPMEHDLYNLTLEASVSHPEIIHQLQVEVCKSEYKNTWLFALGIYKAVFFILGLYMAWETRNVKIPSLNDSEYIGLTVYTVLITTVLHFTLANVTSDRITLAYVTTTSLILFTTTSSMCLLFLPKINAIFRHKDSAHKKIVSSADLKIESNTIRFVKNDDQEPYYRVHIQNFAYRKYVAFLDREIQNLHYKVYIKKNDDPDLLARRATKIYDKLPNLRKYRREKSSSLCGGIPNLFMLTVFPVVIPRASWPYAEHLDRPITEEMAFSSETKLQSIRFEESTLNQKDGDSEDEDQPKGNGSVPSSPLKRIFDNDEYQDTSSDVEEDHNHPSSVLKICKAIVHSPLSNDELKKLEQTPRILITDTEAQNEDNNQADDVDQQLEI